MPTLTSFPHLLQYIQYIVQYIQYLLQYIRLKYNSRVSLDSLWDFIGKNVNLRDLKCSRFYTFILEIYCLFLIGPTFGDFKQNNPSDFLICMKLKPLNEYILHKTKFWCYDDNFVKFLHVWWSPFPSWPGCSIKTKIKLCNALTLSSIWNLKKLTSLMSIRTFWSEPAINSITSQQWLGARGGVHLINVYNVKIFVKI